MVDPSLKRSPQGYHRYFCRAIVDRLIKACGNKVYLSGKPIYTSHEERALHAAKLSATPWRCNRHRGGNGLMAWSG